MKKIAIGCDHGGVDLKAEIKDFLLKEGYEVKDFGTNSTNSCDYPDYALPVAEAVVAKEYDFGILICGTGIGIGIAANKVPGVRAALCSDTFSAHATREHNNANILTLGQRVVGPGLAIDIVKTFLNTEFEGGRHQNRVDKISEIEKKYNK
ncbi:MAG: ribose 5-phosphate isomerase B [Clostridium sartagoforme]|nr:ribose 5-phosphate isomerase B [Clostridium sartagoforme]